MIKLKSIKSLLFSKSSLRICFMTWLMINIGNVSAVTTVNIYSDDSYPPYAYNDDGEAKGLYNDIIYAAAKHMKEFDIKLTPISWKRGKLLMEEGKGFALAGAFYHGHDWPYLYPYSLVFYEEAVLPVCRTKILAQPRPNWPEDFIGLSFGNVSGFGGWGGDQFHQLVHDNKIKYKEFKGPAKTILALVSEQLDCILMEKGALKFELNRLSKLPLYKNQIELFSFEMGDALLKDGIYIGYSKPALLNNTYPYSLEFRQAFDNAIYTMTKSGELEKMISSY